MKTSHVKFEVLSAVRIYTHFTIIDLNLKYYYYLGLIIMNQ